MFLNLTSICCSFCFNAIEPVSFQIESNEIVLFVDVIKRNNLTLSLSHDDLQPPDTDLHAYSRSRHREKYFRSNFGLFSSFQSLTSSKTWVSEFEFELTSSKIAHRNIYMELIHTDLSLYQCMTFNANLILLQISSSLVFNSYIFAHTQRTLISHHKTSLALLNKRY